MHSQSVIKFLVQASGVAADQQMRNGNHVSFRQTPCPEARPRSLGPPLHSRRFPSFPVVSSCFSSLLRRSALDTRRLPELRRLSHAKQARSRQKGVGDVQGDKSAVQLMDLQISSSQVGTKSPVAEEPGPPFPWSILYQLDLQSEVSHHRASGVV